VAVALSHIPPDVDPGALSVDELISSLTLHRAHDGKPLLLVFAEQVSGDLRVCSRRLMEHNKSGGVRESVDGLFVLRQGFALHLDPQRMGWATSRMPGAHFAYLEATPGEVLLKLQSVTLKHLFVAGKVHPGGFDSYLSAPGQAEREVARSSLVSDDAYLAQPPDAGYVSLRS
jgi:hypothetical protein